MSFRNLFRKKNRKLLFTTPSHSQKYCIYHKFKHFYECDISETDAHNPEIVLDTAQKKAAKIYGVKQTLFLTNGSSSGIITGVLACVRKGENVLIWSDAHRCHRNAAELAGANPIYYNLPLIKEWGIHDKTTPDILEEHLKKNTIKAVIITSPTYYGIVSDIKSIKELCKKYDARLIVDEAHGALYPFSDELPESATKHADVVVQSLHKTAGGLNPTALIHSNLDYDIKPYHDKINTTSPSYPLLASIEANIEFLNGNRGQKQLSKLISNLKTLRKECTNVIFGGDDPTKILIKKSGLTGYQLSEILFDQYGTEDEITNEISTMLLCGIGTDDKKLNRLKNILNKL